MTTHDRVVAINFCGGCKPVIDRRCIATGVEQALAARSIAVMFNDWSVPFIVRLSGCSPGCAWRYHPSSRPGPVIAGSTFNGFAVDEASLADRAITAVEAYYGIRPASTAPSRLMPTYPPASQPSESCGIPEGEKPQ